MSNRTTRFLIAVGIQIIVIFAIIIFKMSVLAGGTDVLVHIRPVDPRDFLRGDYITFQYDISNVSRYQIYGGDVYDGQTVYVVLRDSGKYWNVQQVYTYPPTHGELFMKGVVKYGGVPRPASDPVGAPIRLTNPLSENVHIVYGAEEYFIPEGEGRNFSFWNKEAAASLAVDDNGNAVLKKIYINDKPWP